MLIATYRGKDYTDPLVHPNLMSMPLTWNSMSSSEILDKYYSCCIEMANFTQRSLVKFIIISNATLMVLSQISLLPYKVFAVLIKYSYSGKEQWPFGIQTD